MDNAFLQARLQFAVRLLMGLAIVGVLLASSLSLAGNLHGGVVYLIAGGVFLAQNRLLVRREELLGPIAHCLAGELLLSSNYLAVASGGGLQAPALFALPTIPLLAAFLLGRRAALGWSACAVLSVAAITLLREHIPVSHLQGDTEVVVRTVAPIFSVVVITGIALAYERSVGEQQAALQEARERALDASRAKSAFLASMSHEIRTPLGGILGLAELLADTRLEGEQLSMVSMLQRSGYALLGLLNDVLDFSRVEAGAMQLEALPLDIRQIAQEVTGLLGQQAVDKGLTLEHEHSGPAWLVGDALRLRQIMLNLVSNAIKFTERGRVSLRTTTRATGRPGTLSLWLEVEDTGPGISGEDQQRLFSAFTQVGEGIARTHGGSGLGLAIVDKLVQVMGGSIQLRSAPGEGSTFWVQVELEEALPIAPTAEKSPTVEPGLSVLLAEDNLVNQKVFHAMLLRLGCQVIVTADGEQALRVVQRHPEPFDVVLMDCQMPRLSGLEVTRRLRAEGYSGRIVALTANVTPEDRALCKEAGMDGFLTKPLTLRELAEALSEG